MNANVRRKKIIDTVVMIIMLLYVCFILLVQTGVVFRLIYGTLLLSVFFWSLEYFKTPLLMAALLPIVELIWIGMENDWDKKPLMHELNYHSAFYSGAGTPGLIILCIVLPLFFYKLYDKWMIEKPSEE